MITWEHLLTHTSEWQGECFGMPDQVEHWLQAAGLVPPTVHGCRWRSAPERYGYVMSYEVTLSLGEEGSWVPSRPGS